MADNIGVGDFLGQTFKVFGDARNDALAYILIIGGIGALGVILGFTEPETGSLWNVGYQVSGNSTLPGALFNLAAAIVGIVAGYMLLKRFLAGQSRLKSQENRFWSYLGMAILSGIGTVIGLILLIVPGLIVMVRWAASSGFVIGAGEDPTEGLKASWHATKGHGWGIFLAALILFIAGIIGAGLVGGGLALADETIGGIVSAFIEAAFGAVLMAFGIGVYTLVSDDVGTTASVFE